MLVKTRAIVLGTTRYLGNMVLVRMYTESKGQSLFIHKGGKRNQAAFLPLTLVEIVAEEKVNRSIQKLKEHSILDGFKEIYLDPEKSAIGLFLTELISKVVKEEEGNQPLFNYLLNMVSHLNSNEVDTKTFHLIFLIGLSEFAGFYPLGNYSTLNRFFDLNEGKYTSSIPPHPFFLEGSAAESLSRLKDCYETNSKLSIQPEDRRILLAALTDFFKLHLPGMKEMKSHLVLQEI